MNQALIVFAKLPVPGTVKTRLTTLLSEEEAARLYDAFLRDALAQYVQLGVAVRLYLAPPAEGLPPDLVPGGVSVHAQQGEGLGARMLRAFVETFAAGYERIVIIGTDHPTLPSPFIDAAFGLLEEPLVFCIGPSEDGGYYLLGMNELYPQVFEGMRFSHEDVFAQTLRRVAETPAHLAVLPRWYDIDTPEALRRLVAELPDAPGALVHTRRCVAALLQAHPELEAGG